MTDHNSSPRAWPSRPSTSPTCTPSPAPPTGPVGARHDRLPQRPAGALFSDAADYRFRVRPVTIPAGGPAPPFEVGTDEYDITCRFTAPCGGRRRQPVQEGTCTLPNGATVAFRRGRRAGPSRCPAPASTPGCAWTRSSSTAPGTSRRSAPAAVAFQADGINAAEGWNVLGIVVELDVATMFGRAPGTLFAVAAETVTTGKFPMRLERFGRVFVKNQLLGEYGVDTVNRDLDLREL